MRKMAALIAVAAALGFAPRHANAQSVVTCESVSGRTTTCPANVSGARDPNGTHVAWASVRECPLSGPVARAVEAVYPQCGSNRMGTRLAA